MILRSYSFASGVGRVGCVFVAAAMEYSAARYRFDRRFIEEAHTSRAGRDDVPSRYRDYRQSRPEPLGSDRENRVAVGGAGVGGSLLEKELAAVGCGNCFVSPFCAASILASIASSSSRVKALFRIAAWSKRPSSSWPSRNGSNAWSRSRTEGLTTQIASEFHFDRLDFWPVWSDPLWCGPRRSRLGRTGPACRTR